MAGVLGYAIPGLRKSAWLIHEPRPSDPPIADFLWHRITNLFSEAPNYEVTKFFLTTQVRKNFSNISNNSTSQLI